MEAFLKLDNLLLLCDGALAYYVGAGLAGLGSASCRCLAESPVLTLLLLLAATPLPAPAGLC